MVRRREEKIAGKLDRKSGDGTEKYPVRRLCNRKYLTYPPMFARHICQLVDIDIVDDSNGAIDFASREFWMYFGIIRFVLPFGEIVIPCKRLPVLYSLSTYKTGWFCEKSHIILEKK
jgi:hypothetical protein